MKKNQHKTYREKNPPENPRYEVVGQKDSDEDWNPHDWIGKIVVTNKRDYIAIPPRIELCIAFLLDSKYYTGEVEISFCYTVGTPNKGQLIF